MSTGANALATQVAEAKASLIAHWDSKINEEDGSFEAVFGDPSQTPCTHFHASSLRLRYFNLLFLCSYQRQ